MDCVIDSVKLPLTSEEMRQELTVLKNEINRYQTLATSRHLCASDVHLCESKTTDLRNKAFRHYCLSLVKINSSSPISNVVNSEKFKLLIVESFKEDVFRDTCSTLTEVYQKIFGLIYATQDHCNLLRQRLDRLDVSYDGFYAIQRFSNLIEIKSLENFKLLSNQDEKSAETLITRIPMDIINIIMNIPCVKIATTAEAPLVHKEIIKIPPQPIPEGGLSFSDILDTPALQPEEESTICGIQ